MGGLASGIFGLLDGNPTQSEQNELSSLTNYETPQGEQDTSAASGFYGDILSGDPSKIAETLAPEISANQQATQQKKDTLAEFGNRSGGSNSSANSADATSRGNIINLIGSEQNAAAAGEASLGTNLLSQSSGNINSEATLARQQQQAQQADVGDIAQGAAQIATGFIDPAAAATPAVDPYQTLFNAENAGPVATEDSNFTGLIQ